MMFSCFIRYGVIGIFLACILFCTATPVNTAGGSSDTEVSARISGVAVDVNGIPVVGAIVQLRRADYQPGLALIGMVDSSTKRLNCTTDEHGMFVLDSVDDGDYMVEITSGDSAGAIAECKMVNAVSCTVASVIKPVGMLVGQIDYSYYNSSMFPKTKIEVLGTEHIVRPDSNLWFQIPVPEGHYSMKISVDSSSFDSMVMDVDVTASQPRYLGMVRLNFLPQPSCWTFDCDSLVVRTLLDSTGHADIPVTQVVTRVAKGRIAALSFNGLSMTASLASLGKLSGLEELDLGNTGMTDSCRFLSGLWKLRVLRLNNNNIIWLSHFVESLYMLEILDVTNNELTTLPERVGQLMNLMEIKVSGNHLCTIAPYTAGWLDFIDPGWRTGQTCP